MVRINASRFANHDAFLKICDAKKDTKTTKIAASFFHQLTAVLRYFLSEISSQKSHQIRDRKLKIMLCVFFANFVRILRICCVYTQFPLPWFFNRIFLWCSFEMLIWTLYHDIYMLNKVIYIFFFIFFFSCCNWCEIALDSCSDLHNNGCIHYCFKVTQRT